MQFSSLHLDGLPSEYGRGRFVFWDVGSGGIVEELCNGETTLIYTNSIKFYCHLWLLYTNAAISKQTD